VCLAAATVGISGKGGWSKKRGAQLKERAANLASSLDVANGWTKGPIVLGEDGASMAEMTGSTRSAGRAYECGAIVSRPFSTNSIPPDLGEWLSAAFEFYDAILSNEDRYIRTIVPTPTDAEWNEWDNAGITGARAETFFLEWCLENLRDWGPPADKTRSVGLGYDVGFPQVDRMVEVKGFRGPVGSARLTQREWRRAKEAGDRYHLCLVYELDDEHGPRVSLIADPFGRLQGHVIETRRLQITYTASKAGLVSACEVVPPKG
jgi:hypothetical protein